jgi:CMP-N,N'-diacetyllegionaminic acid synthase
MKQRASRVVVILARGGSKRIPRKNLQLIGEKPLVLISAEVAVASGYRAFISSDDREILNLVYPDNVVIHQRSDDLSEDSSTSEEAILEIANHFSWSNDMEVILLPPTSPLRTTEHLNYFIEEWERLSSVSHYDQAMSVLATRQDLWSLDGKSAFRIRDQIFGRTESRQSQERVDLFIETSAIYLSRLGTLRRGLKFSEGKIALISLPKIASIDIDEFDDLMIARALYEGRK